MNNWRKFNNVERLLYRELFKKDCYEFCKFFWEDVDPIKFIDGFLVKYFCEVFQYMARPWVGYDGPENPIPEIKIDDMTDVIDVSKYDKNKLNISTCPRHGKSNLFNVLCPTWLFINDPIKVASVSHSQDLAGKMNAKRQKLLNSEKFKFFFPEISLTTNTTFSLTDNRNGEMYSIPKNSITGMGCDCLIVDDLTNVMQAKRDAAEMNSSWVTYTEVLPSRINDVNKYVWMNIMQRIAPNDITGRILSDAKLTEEYIFVVLPAQFDRHTYIVCPISGDIFEFQAGDYLWPERFGDYSSIKASVTSDAWNSQYLQKPQFSDKTIIKEDMIIERDACDCPDITQAETIYASHDFPVKDKEKSDFLGSILAYKVGMTLYIVDCLEKRMAYVKSIEYVTNLDNAYPGIVQIIEDKANGSPILQQVKDTVAGLQAFQVGTKSKVQRLESASVYINNVVFVRKGYNKLKGAYYLLEPLLNLKNRLIAFPFVQYDDIVDAFSQLCEFVFMDRKYMVYGKSFNQENIIDASTEKYNYSTCFFNKDGDIWKVLDIAIEYGEITKLIVLRETIFKSSLSDGLVKLKEFAPDKNVFIDSSYTDALAGLYTNDVVIEKYVDEDFDKSVAHLNLAFSNKTILIDKECGMLKADIDNFKYKKDTEEAAEFRTTRDGFVACIRSAIKYYGGIV